MEPSQSRRFIRLRIALLLTASAVKVWVIPTNEELMIARHTADLLGP